MSKAEDYITQNTKTLEEYGKEYFKWLTPDQARRAVEIAREEIYKWLYDNYHIYRKPMIDDLKQAMKHE